MSGGFERGPGGAAGSGEGDSEAGGGHVPAVDPTPPGARAAAAPRPTWQQPELAWLIGMPLGFAGAWLAGELRQPLLAPVIALLLFSAPWVAYLRAARPRSAAVALCACALGLALGQVDAALLGHLTRSPLQSLGLPAPWLPAVVLDAGERAPELGLAVRDAVGLAVRDSPAWRVAWALAVVGVGWVLGGIGLSAAVPPAVLLMAAEFGAGVGRVALGLTPLLPRDELRGGRLQEGFGALAACDPGTLLLGLGAAMAAGALALGGRLEPASEGPRTTAGLARLGGVAVAVGTPLALFGTAPFRAFVRGLL